MSSSFAQELKSSRKTSYFTYVFKLTARQTKDLILNQSKENFEKYLTHPVDSFPTDSNHWANKTRPSGHYLLLKAVENNLEISYQTYSAYQANLFNNARDFNLIITKKGSATPLENAYITLNKKKIDFDEKAGVYVIPKSNKKGLLEVQINGDTNYYRINRSRNNSGIKRFSNQLLSLIPVYLPRRLYNRIFKRYTITKNYGYLVFNKPKYLPGDTVKLKAFIVSKRGKPLNKKVQLSVNKGYYSEKVILNDTIFATSKGAYVYEFPITDSFELDQYYSVELSDLKEKNLISNRFKLEDYQLDEVTYAARLDKEKYNSNEKISIYISGKDANGLNALDTRASIKISTQYPYNFQKDSVFIPNHLWAYSTHLDPVGETKITVPDSIFPDCGLKAIVEITFNNSNNETHEKDLTFDYTHINKWIDVELKNDSVFATYLEKGNAVPQTGKLIILSQKDTLEKRAIHFPFQANINSNLSKLIFKHKQKEEYLRLREKGVLLECRTERTKDSVFITFDNPRKLLIHYSIFKGNKVIQKGVSKHLNWKKAEQGNTSYFVVYHYIWAGKDRREEREIHAFKKQLKITVDQPPMVYPGQKEEINISVKDYKDRPLKDVNLTAFSINSQFGNIQTPEIPYMGKGHKSRSIINRFQFDKTIFKRELTINSNWKKQLTLNNIPYFQFILPENGISYHYDTSMVLPQPQFAPHLFDKGEKIDVLLIYLDHQLIYYYDSDHNPTYSFIADSGYHHIRIRTSKNEYSIDSLLLNKNHKLDFSIDVNHLPPHVKAVKKTPEFTNQELKTINASMLYLHNNFKGKFISVWQHESKQYIKFYPGYKNQLKIGPFTNDSIHIGIPEKLQTSFLFEPHYTYTLSKGLIKLKENRHYNIRKRPYSYQVKSQKPCKLLSFIPFELILPAEKVAPVIHPYSTKKGNGTLKLEFQLNEPTQKIRLTNKDTSIVYDIYSRQYKNIHNLYIKKYALELLTNSNFYRYNDSINILPNGINYYRINSFNMTLYNSSEQLSDNDSTEFKFGKGIIKGKITDKETGEPLPFVNIMIDGTTRGTTSDFDGNFKIVDLEKGQYTLKFSFVGYSPERVQNVSVKNGQFSFLDVQLEPGVKMLEEVVVVKYALAGVSRSRRTRRSYRTRPLACPSFSNGELSNAVRMPRRSANAMASAFKKFKIQNINNDSSKFGSPKNYNSVTEGIIDIKTIRNQFKDYGYWQPNLITDNKGEASFQVTFPDNITEWSSYVIGMDHRKHSGIALTSTKAMKPMLGQLATPRFLLTGDKAKAIGKIANYTPEEQQLKSTFKINEQSIFSHDTLVKNSVVEQLDFEANSLDSIQLEYKIERKDGYVDGEKRSIPVYRKGLKETAGSFYVLRNDTTLQLSLDSEATTHLSAYGTPIGVLLDELKQLKEYPHFCMEQTASKLLGLLSEKEICATTGKSFKHNRLIKKMIRRLEKVQNDDGGWGWWPGTSTNNWMSIYVTHALFKAKSDGYSTKSLEKATQYLIWNLDVLSQNDLIFSLDILAENKIKLPYKSYINQLEKDTLSLLQKFTLIKVKQAQNLKYSIKEIEQSVNPTYLGNYYWDDQKSDWYNSSINTTLKAYQILCQKDSLHPYLPKIRDYLLEIKAQNKWQNTIQKAQIIQTILRDLKHEYGKTAPLSVQLGEHETIQQFPFQKVLPKASSELNISKKGTGPLYLVTHQNKWNNAPSVKDSIFSIKTWFEKDNEKIDHLKAGVPVQMKVELLVSKKGDYAMVEIPIPAGCSYGRKNVNRLPAETHREYFKNKVIIYCEQLNAATYTFNIELQPRFNGQYTVNPARAEYMYLPILYGNNALKQIMIKED